MIATESALIEEFKKHYQNNSSPIISKEKREEAWSEFEKAGLPTKKTEEYKYIPVTRLLEKDFDASISIASSPAEINNEEIKRHYISGAAGYRIVLVNGQLNNELSDFPESIKLKNLSKLEDPSLKAHIGKYAYPHEDPFIALNTAVAEDGFVFCISKNAVLDKPLYIYNLTDTNTAQVHHQARNLIMMEANSQAKIIMVNKGFGENTAFINEVNEIVMEQNAHLEWIRLEDEPEKCYHINNTRVHQDKNSNFNSVALMLAGGLIRNNLHVVIDGEGSEGNLWGLYMIGDNSIVDNHTVVDHKKPNANSNELYKGILFDRARGVFNGKIYVRQDAQKTNAFQSNNNVLISPDAVINTKPQLEIWADDVKCTHGCTSGQLDEDAVFYLQARGIHKKKAEAMLLQAFAFDVIGKISLEEVRTYMEEYVNNKLEL
ncbi:MAG: Fe-S cluster assembly protein SufD [Candidatus Cyclobacteriaceae bacterium M2_1C_046]